MVEAEAYVKKKWMQVNSLELWGLEEAILFDEVKPTAPIYDVGIYSSGGWARTHDLWRCYDLEILKKGGYQDNPLYIKTKFIVDVVCELKAKQEMKVRFYLHPHELALFQNHAIQPPILAQLKENGIDCSFEASNSISEIYESQIGLGVSSTILFDRIHLDLQSLYYNSPDIYDPIVDTRYLGKYADLAFANAEELKTKLELALGRNA